MARSKASRLITAARRARVVAYKRAGGTYREVAEAVRAEYAADGRENELPSGWDERYAHKDLRDELTRLQEEVSDGLEEWRAVEIMRLEEMHSRLYPMALGTEEVPPDVRAVEAVRRLMERRAKLLGLDAPDRMENLNMDVADLSDEALERIANGEHPAKVVADTRKR